MIESLNALGLDWVVFGNHEFDYDLDDLQARLDESDFVWMAANARLVGEGVPPQPFFKNRSKGIEPCPDNLSCVVRDADGTEIRLGVFGVLVDSGKKSFVSYSDFMDVAKEEYNELKSRTDLVVALTHLDIDDDLKLSASLPNVPLLMGGHDHDNMLHRVGANTVAKADANARTVYVHTVQFNKRTGKSTVKSELIKVDSSIPDDPKTAAVVSKWEQIKKSALKDSGFDADMPVIQLEKPLDCRDAYTRHQQMPVGEMITSAMMAASKNKPECAILNSGSIRVDDVLTGTLTELDIVRMLPFGGGIVEVDMTGVALQKVLNIGTETNKGKGGYLQIRGVKPAPNSSGWLVGKMELNTEKTYRVVLPSFLLTGNETNLGFLKTNTSDGGKTTDNPDIPRMFLADKNNPKDLRVDIRRALIAFLRGE
jgi:2',3'-cyclic-nucleotide 2'-phosphodiesterase (5'-nucleotidase family)